MKKAILLLFCLCCISYSNAKAQENKLIGTWTVISMTQVTGQDTLKRTDEFKAGGNYADYYFQEGGKLKHKSSLLDETPEFTQEGTWKIERGKLILALQYRGQEIVLDYDYELTKDNLSMTLTRTNPEGVVMKMLMALTRKQI